MSSPVSLVVDPHPSLELIAFVATYPEPLGSLAGSPGAPAIAAALEPGFVVPGLARPDDAVRAAVRDLLRHGGFKPTGRSKPASEYLVAAAADGRLRAINVAVDIGNAASLHGGLPISVIDLDRTRPPLGVRIAAPGARYVFNPAGQEIDVGGLLSLHDADGPCANAVKDAQRSKTDDATRRTLTLVWGTRALAERAATVAALARELGRGLGAEIADLAVSVAVA
jgi:DNA/RNA-binding domain of Phe-tRNA-synthetase-like protein